MKKVFLLLVTILLLGVINVKAEEEYNIVIDENNNFTLTDSSNNQITDTTIAKYEDNTLTLGEGKYFNQIKIKNDTTITSNDKGVYIKELTTKEGNTNVLANVTINNLKVREDDTYICKIIIGGNLIIDDSEINSKSTHSIDGYSYVTNAKIKATSYYANKNDSEGYGLKIINSEIETGILCPLLSGLYIKDSTLDISSTLYSYGKVYIDGATIDVGISNTSTGTRITFQGRNNGEEIIKNSTIKAKNSIENSSNDLTIENSIIEIGGISPNNSLLKISNSTLKVKNGLSYMRAIIEDSNLEVGYIGFITYIEGEKYLKINNSSLTTSGNAIRTDNISNTEINNSNIIFNNWLKVNGNIEINNTNMKIMANKQNYPGLFIENDLNINNSNVTIDHTENNKIVSIIKGNIFLDNKIFPIDNNKTDLKIKEYTKEEVISNVSSISGSITDDENVKVFTYEDNSYSDYVKLATQKTATFKVKNGTWLDGTSDDIKIDYLYGEPLEIENLPKEVQELLTSKMGSWSMDLNNLDTTQDLDIEFKYDLINPETKRNLLILFVIIVISIVVFTKIKTKHVNY